MIQIAFNAAYDPFHAIFRLLRLRSSFSEPLVEGHVRLIDFFFLFPHLIDRIRLRPDHRRYKKLAANYAASQPYGMQPDLRMTFSKMQPMQTSGLQTLASEGFLDQMYFEASLVVATSKPVSPKLTQRIDDSNKRDAGLLDFLSTLMREYRFDGPDGLKARTGLMEFRYDAV